jgi:hypothetical protein
MSMLKRVLDAALARWSLDANERQFVEAAGPLFAPQPSAPGEVRESILVQMPPDYQCMIKFLGAIHLSGRGKANCVGLWHQNIMSAPRGENFQPVRRQVRKLFSMLDFKKWKRLYHAIGLRRFVNLGVPLSVKWANRKAADRIWRGLKTRQDVLGLVLNGTPCGDLVYDTYLRYRIQPTVDLDDPYLRRLIAQALDAQNAIRRHLKDGKFDKFFTNYSSYIQHGIPVREAVRAGVEVYSCGNLTQVYKKLSVDDPLHAEAHWEFVEKFAKVEDKDSARKTAEVALQQRFSGAVDRATSYMKSSAYTANASGALPENVEGVVFLHDFFDSPHGHRFMVFADFDEWVRFTLKTIEAEGLPIAIKPHPNQLPESAEVVEKLKAEFPSITFLDPKLPNNIIFNAGIKCGISIYGTVLSELAYHGIAALSAGDHPSIDFDIAINSTSVDDYRQKLIGFRHLEVPALARDRVLEFYYTQQWLKNEDLEVDFGALDVTQLEQNKSNALKTVLETYEPFQNARRAGA